MPGQISVGIVGVGNCASSLVQGIAHYQNGGANEQIGLMHWDLGGYRPKDIRVVSAWDVDRRKVGRDVSEAIGASPNNTKTFATVPGPGVRVERGPTLDGLGPLGEKHHTLEENIQVRSLVDRARLFAGLLTRLA